MPEVRIVHFITGLGVGGAEQMLLKLCAHSAAAGMRHVVVSLGGEGTLAPAFRDAGAYGLALGFSRVGGSPMALSKLRRLVAGFRPHVLQGWMYHGNLAALFARALSREAVPVCWNIRQTLYELRREKFLTSLVIRIGGRLSGRVARIVYNSTTSALQHERLGYSSSARELIPNGFDCSAFRPDPDVRRRVRGALGWSESQIVVGLVTRYHPMKDHRTFVAAAGLVARRHPDVRFLLVGRGVDTDASGVRAMLAGTGVDRRSVVLGERHDVAELCAAMDIACSSSAWGEGFSNAVGEAMACAVPCVVTDVGDSASIVGDTGVVVPPGDPDALAAGILRLVDAADAGRRTLGADARKRIERNYSIGSIVERYRLLYESLAAGAGRTSVHDAVRGEV